MNTFTFFPQATGAPPAQSFRLAEIPPTEPEVEFAQLSQDLDGVQLSFTDWCQLLLRLPKTNAVRYVNVSYNDNWVIQNVPILSGLSGGVADRVCLNFPLGTYGKPVFAAQTGFAVTANVVTSPPPSTAITLLGVNCHTLASGEQEIQLTYQPAQPLVGGPALRSAQAKPNFPNREQRKNECAPAAIVDSLQYLDAVFGLNLPEADIRLQTIKDAMRWTSDIGAPVGDDLQNAEWLQGKRQHMRDRNLPIVTEVMTNAVLALAAIRSCYDVEIRVTGHAACVVGIVELGGGRYSLTLAHDVGQGKNGGNVLEVVTLDTNTGKVTGFNWSPDFIQFIIERPE